MAVLQFKMNRINSVIDQPVTTISKLPEPKGLSKTQSNPNKVQPIESDGFSSSSSKKRTVRRHRITTIHASDFETEDELPVSNY